MVKDKQWPLDLIISPRRGIVASVNFPSKTYQKNGKWVEKPDTTKVSVCACHNKYIKTRENQKQCIKCIYKAELR